MSLLGLDVGTTGCKAVAFDPDGRILAQAYREYPLLHPQRGFSELDTDRLWQDIAKVLIEVNQQLQSDPVKALSISCQGEAVTAVDRDGNPLFNFSVSFDHRTVPQARWWQEHWGSQRLFQITGMPLHAMHTINKIMWYKQECPRLYERAARFLCVEDFVNFKLTGQYATDWSLAARTMAFDVINKCWCTEILQAAEVNESILPTPYPSGTAVGEIIPSVANNLGFQEKVVVATGGHDQPCGALGAGIVTPGTAMNATGTSDVVCPAFAQPILTDQMLENNYCCYPHTNAQQYVSIAFNLAGGLLLRWYRDTLCESETEKAQQTKCDAYDVIIREASSEIKSLFFLPHFVGAGTPYLDSHSRGAVVGLTVDTSKQDLSRAVLDSINYEMKLNIELMNKAGLGIRELRAIGGGAKSQRWLQMKADAFGMPVSTMRTSEAASLGAAMLAGLSIGSCNNVKEAVASMVHVEKTYSPDNYRTRLYEDMYQQYKQLYPTLKQFYMNALDA